MFKLKIKLKKLGKKKLQTLNYDFNQEITSLQMLISEIVKIEVQKFNDKLENPTITSFLSIAAIEQQSQEGKVAFGDNYNQTKAIESEAIENALLAFQDGMFTVFIDDEEIKDLITPIQLLEESEVVFLRMTFLTGRL